MVVYPRTLTRRAAALVVASTALLCALQLVISPAEAHDFGDRQHAATGTTPGHVVRCAKATLRISGHDGDVGLGHRSMVLEFTNSGSKSCWIRGYAAVTALDRTGHSVASARHTLCGYLGGLCEGRVAPLVTLSAGQSASALVEALAFDPRTGNPCTPYHRLRVIVPHDSARSVTSVPWSNDGCADLQVHPIVPGMTGNG